MPPASVRQGPGTRGARALALLFFLLPWSSPAAGQSKGDDRLEQATALVRSGREPDLRKGAELCAEINTVASLELLLQILDQDQPHFRDVVWERLPQFTDAAARQRVVAELGKNKRNERTRQWCAQLLGMFGDAVAVEALEKALGDKVPEVRSAAAQALGRIGVAGAAKAISKLATDKIPFTRAYAREAVALPDAANYGALLREGLADVAVHGSSASSDESGVDMHGVERAVVDASTSQVALIKAGFRARNERSAPMSLVDERCSSESRLPWLSGAAEARRASGATNRGSRIAAAA